MTHPELIPIPRPAPSAHGRKDFELNVGRTELFEQDPEYWRSVHVEGSGGERQRQQQKDKEITEWTSKLKVADPRLRTHSKPVVANRSKLDRLEGILKDPPLKQSFRQLGLEEPPPSVLSKETYDDPAATYISRTYGKYEHTAPGTRSFQSGLKMDRSHVLDHLSNRKVDPVKASEKKGPKWVPTPQPQREQR